MLYDNSMPIMKQNSLDFLKHSYELVYDIESLILRVYLIVSYSKR